eukprot:761135-Prorocentrum_minimum.AAC.2
MAADAPRTHPWGGVVVPMVTPLLGEDSLDSQGLRRLVANLVKARVHGLFMLVRGFRSYNIMAAQSHPGSLGDTKACCLAAPKVRRSVVLEAGTTGEAPHLSIPLRKRLVSETAAALAEAEVNSPSAVKLFVGISDCNLANTVELAAHAKV